MLNLRLGLWVEDRGLDARLPLEVHWLVCSSGAKKRLCLCRTFCLPRFLLHFFFLFTCFFFLPVTPTASWPRLQYCSDTSLASIIPGSDEPAGQEESDNVWKMLPPAWDQSHQAKPLVCRLYLTIPKPAERMYYPCFLLDFLHCAGFRRLGLDYESLMLCRFVLNLVLNAIWHAHAHMYRTCTGTRTDIPNDAGCNMKGNHMREGWKWAEQREDWMESKARWRKREGH